MQQNAGGPEAWANWRAALAGVSSLGSAEIACYTDAHITGQVEDGLGPYMLLNTVPLDLRIGLPQPAVVLRFELHAPRLEPFEMPMTETDYTAYHGGWLGDELASLISLALGLRLAAGGVSRVFVEDGDPRGRPRELDHQRPYLPPPSFRGAQLPGIAATIKLDDCVPRLASYPRLSVSEAIALVRAARSYQRAIWSADGDPNLAWLSLVSSVEAAAGHWARGNDDPVELLREFRPALADRLAAVPDSTLLGDVAAEVGHLFGATKKFRAFLLHHLPPPPTARPARIFQVDWSRSRMRAHLHTIYHWRSRALHDGIPFPNPMCWPPRCYDNLGVGEERPPGTSVTSGNAVWVAKDVPMFLHTFAYLVRGALCTWWDQMVVARLAGSDETAN
jgi:hypothetical protein